MSNTWTEHGQIWHYAMFCLSFVTESSPGAGQVCISNLVLFVSAFASNCA